MAYEAALSPGSLQQVYNYLRQARATGKVITNRDVRAAYEGALAAEAKQNLLNRQISNTQANWQKQFDQNQSNWQKQWENQMALQKQNANSQNVIGGAALLLNAPKMVTGAKSLWDTGKDIKNWLYPNKATGAQGQATAVQTAQEFGKLPKGYLASGSGTDASGAPAAFASTQNQSLTSGLDSGMGKALQNENLGYNYNPTTDVAGSMMDYGTGISGSPSMVENAIPDATYSGWSSVADAVPSWTESATSAFDPSAGSGFFESWF
jgi:hypothetical protein